MKSRRKKDWGGKKGKKPISSGALAPANENKNMLPFDINLCSLEKVKIRKGGEGREAFAPRGQGLRSHFPKSPFSKEGR